MFQFILRKISTLLGKNVPATGIGLFRILYGLVTLQEIGFLYYFNHLIFDPIPFIDVEFPTITLFLCLWGIVAVFVTLGYRYSFSVFANYIFWLVFVNFTTMQRDFDGGFDLFMIGAGFFLLFMPGNKAFSLDKLRYRLNTPFDHSYHHEPAPVSVLAYYLPVIVCLGLLYFDSAIHKLFAEQWRNGLGPWLPATQPYYVSALDWSWLLNQELLQKVIGYTILVFQFSFLFLFWHKWLRPIYLFIGCGLHFGIIVTLNIYPFGMAMLMFYTLMVPFSWWRAIGKACKAKQPTLTVFYDQLCPLCNRTVHVIGFFDIFRCIAFKPVQQHAAHYPALSGFNLDTLLTDIYALDTHNRVYSGLDTYIQISKAMRYTYPIGLLFNLPGIYQLAARQYRRIADTRNRIQCTDACVAPSKAIEENTLYQRFFEQYATQKPKTFSRKLAKLLTALLVLQLNSSIHYGLLYRLGVDLRQNSLISALTDGSNALISISQTFFGIAPHALYLHDHFAGYDRILAITYIDINGEEQWLPFVNEQGRLLAPNWGRVHSMWANIAVTPTIDNVRVKKFIMKVTAFWGIKQGLDLNNTEFRIKLKKIESPTHWVYDQLHRNFESPWVTIGSVRWSNNVISYDLPSNINAL